MHSLPIDLLAALPEGTGPVAELWWQRLSDADRQQIVGLWDERLEVRFFTPQPDATGCLDDWNQVPVVEGGRVLSDDDDGQNEWGPSYFERLLQHPELVLAY
ncbi:MAG: hypothetical protein JNK93_21160 [Planctomycetia bacterium]|nr:hypothetical protein [Planctomycetia bacterium]